ncbi:hypothetical protein GALMADRAFT_41866, partial [Galerina marginata CBS 339.88]
ATSNLTPMALYLKHTDIVQRGIRREICQSLITIFDWCSSTGPRLAKRLVQIHQLHGYIGLHNAAPHFADLVDHIIQHVLVLFTTQVNAQKVGAKTKPKCLEPDLEVKLRLGQIRESPSSVPFNLYGLRTAVPSRSGSVVKLPHISLPGQILCLGPNDIYTATINVVQQFWVKEFIMPPLRIIDNETRSRKHT